MSRRRPIFAAQAAVPEPVPIAVEWSDPRTPAGHCPKCGLHVGRAVRAHAKHCDGTKQEA